MSIFDIFRKKPAQEPQKKQPRIWMIDPLIGSIQNPIISASTNRQGVDGFTFDTLDSLASIPEVGAIINRRMHQCSEAMTKQTDQYSLGWVVEKIADDGTISTKISKGEKGAMDEIIGTILNGGDRYMQGGGMGAMLALMRDSLKYDHAGFDILKLRNGKPYGWLPADCKTIRFAEFDREELNSGKMLDDHKYVQVVNNRIVSVLGHRDFALFIRNPRTDLRAYGYGYPELEQFWELATHVQHLDRHQFNLYTQGIQANQLLVIISKMGKPEFNDFVAQMTALANGVENANRVPVIQLDPDHKEELNSIPLTRPPLENQTQEWRANRFKMLCAAFSMDPAELGVVYGNEGQKSSMSSAPVSERISMSKEAGLFPLYKRLSQLFTESIAQQWGPEFRVRIAGFDTKSESDQIKLDKELVGSKITLNEIRKRDGLKPLKGGDVVLNTFYLQSLSMTQGQEGEDEQDGDAGGNWWETEDEKEDGVEKGSRWVEMLKERMNGRP